MNKRRQSEYLTGHFRAFFPEDSIRPAIGLVHELFDRAADGSFHSLLSYLRRKIWEFFYSLIGATDQLNIR